MSYNFPSCANCGKATVTIPTPPANCDNCLVAPTLEWQCDAGPAPGDVMNFNILDEANISLPEDGTFEFSKFSHDSVGFSSVTIATNGDVMAQTRLYYEHRKVYYILYKIREVGGIRSITGKIGVCMQDMCKNCIGVCDPLTSDCVYGIPQTFEVPCNSTATIDITNWDFNTIEFINVDPCISNVTKTGNEITADVGDCVGVGESVSFQAKIKKGTAETCIDIVLKIADLCANVCCDSCYECDKCTGDCVQVCGDVGIEVSNTAGKGADVGIEIQ